MKEEREGKERGKEGGREGRREGMMEEGKVKEVRVRDIWEIKISKGS
jgi:hypothetical protein